MSRVSPWSLAENRIWSSRKNGPGCCLRLCPEVHSLPGRTTLRGARVVRPGARAGKVELEGKGQQEGDAGGKNQLLKPKCHYGGRCDWYSASDFGEHNCFGSPPTHPHSLPPGLKIPGEGSEASAGAVLALHNRGGDLKISTRFAYLPGA